MYKNLFSWLSILLVLPSCSKSAPTITMVCEENAIGNCIIKWETAPVQQGQVKVYASISADHIPEETPIATANIADGKIVIVTNDPTQRYYYQLVFNNKYRAKIACRNINIASVQNFRDLGGYKSLKDKKTTRWGMVYRSAQIDSVPSCAYQELKNIGIRTIIDLREASERLHKPSPHDKNFNVVHTPIASGNIENILKKIREDKIQGDTVPYLIKQMNREIVTKHQKEIKAIFALLLDRQNYPIVIQCASGQGRTGIISALLLASLDVDEDVIMKDYQLSNEYFNIPKASNYAYQLPPNSQEAITTVYSAKSDFLNAAKEQIEASYGSVQSYLKTEIGLSNQEIEKLRNILLE